MATFLTCSLHAPMASWGDIAMGEMRGTWPAPSRSAWLGIVGAALGIEREDDAGQAALEAGYGLAMCAWSVGVTQEDFQTAQSAPRTVIRKRGAQTRREILALEPLGTVLSRRRFRADALYSVAMWARPQATGGRDASGPDRDDVPMPRWSLSQIQAALRAPHFTLYAGRKAQPLGWPLDPELQQVDTLAEALKQARRRLGRLQGAGLPVSFDEPAFVLHDALDLDGAQTGLEPRRTETRRDGIDDRRLWHFRNRTVHVGMLSGAPTADAQATAGHDDLSPSGAADGE